MKERDLISRVLPEKNKKLKFLLITVVPWILAFAMILAYRQLYSFDNNTGTSIGLTLIDISALLLCSLLINRFVIPRMLYRRKIFYFILSIIAIVTGYFFLVKFAQKQWYEFRGIYDEVAVIFGTLSYQVFNTLLVVFLGCLGIILFRLLSDHYVFEKRYEELQREKAETELSFLKAQINPHFLFNSINSIYGHIDRSNQTARNILLRFSEMLRYQLYECNADTIPIEREIAYLRNYIELQKLRRDDNIQTELKINQFPPDLRIAPLLFIPFVENAFKYVSNSDVSPNRIVIGLGLKGDELGFECMNSREARRPKEILAANGIGIENVKRRLVLLYPLKHSLEITETENEFQVLLKIKVR